MWIIIIEGLVIFSIMIHGSYGINSTDDENSPKSSMKCSRLVPSTTTLSCNSRIRLMWIYNNFRNKIASGKYYGHPTVGNMLRVKWLMSMEKYVHEPLRHCDVPSSDERNVTIRGDAYNADRTFTCEVVYKRQLFTEWSSEEVLNFLIESYFERNFFLDFDENGRYQRVFVEGMGCSIALDYIGALTLEAFMGCGFCTSPPRIEPIYEIKPCSRCDFVPSQFEAIPTSCDYHFRSLCYGRYSIIDPSTMETDYSQVTAETGCASQIFLVSRKCSGPKTEIPRLLMSHSVLFLKITYILPMMTIGLLIYYMVVLKRQKFRELSVPKTLYNIRLSQ